MSVAQINASLQAALAVAGYTGRTSSAQVKQDLNGVLVAITTLNSSIQTLSPSGTSVTQVLAVVPQGISLAVAVVKSTSGLKNLSTPLTPEEGETCLAIVQGIRAQLLSALNATVIRIPAVDAAIPGLSKFGLTTLKNLADPFIQALIAAAPPSIPRSTLQEIQTSVTSAIQNALAKAP